MGQNGTAEDRSVEPAQLAKEYCGKWTWRNWETDETRQAFCGCMSCPRARCKAMFWRRRVELLSDLIAEFDLKKFFTLTLDRRILSKEVTPWEYIHRPWCSLRRVLKRKHDTFRFAAVLEGHKDDHYPHVHGFTNLWMKQADWSRHWAACGGGSIVWVERVRDEKASEYVGKSIAAARYVGKDQLIEAYKHRGNRRIFWRSTGMKTRAEIDGKPSPWNLEYRKWVDNGHRTCYTTGREDSCRQDS